MRGRERYICELLRRGKAPHTIIVKHGTYLPIFIASQKNLNKEFALVVLDYCNPLKITNNTSTLREFINNPHLFLHNKTQYLKKCLEVIQRNQEQMSPQELVELKFCLEILQNNGIQGQAIEAVIETVKEVVERYGHHQAATPPGAVAVAPEATGFTSGGDGQAPEAETGHQEPEHQPEKDYVLDFDIEDCPPSEEGPDISGEWEVVEPPEEGQEAPSVPAAAAEAQTAVPCSGTNHTNCNCDAYH